MNTGKNIMNTIIIGFALFSAFFGAGNLIFPPTIGLLAGRERGPAAGPFRLLRFYGGCPRGEKEGGITSDMGKTFSILLTE